MLTALAAERTADDLALLGVLVGASALLVAAYRFRVPYPILLVIGGAALGFAPGLPTLTLSPNAVLVVFLPPLLYAAAFFSSLRDLRDNTRSIGALAIGLVVATALGVGVVAHLVVDDLSWAASFTLGAIVAPTDAVAATAIAARVGAPRRLCTIIEGESLVNDSTGLIVYKVAVAATVTGSFSLLDAGFDFIVNAAAGIAIGVVVGAMVTPVRRMIDDASTEITISLLTPYFAYLPAEALGVSAVLSAVTAGIWLGWRAPELVTPATRIQLFSVWEVLAFVLNAALFTLLGMQLPDAVQRISDNFSAGQLTGWAAVIAGSVIVIRLLWVFPVTYGPRVFRRVRESEPRQPLSHTLFVGWTGMRGAVSLAAALALPPSFEARDLIVFLVFGVIFATLLIQGLTLSTLIRRLGIQDDGKTDKMEYKARIKASKAAIALIDQLADEDWVREDTAGRIRGLHEFRINRFKSRFDAEDDGAIDERSARYQRLQRMVLEAQRAEIIRLRNERIINDEVLHRIERDLDLEDTRLDLPAGD